MRRPPRSTLFPYRTLCRSAREALLASPNLPGNIRRLFPICTPAASDSANFDEVLELLHLAGRSLPHAVLMMIPEAWENDPDIDRKSTRLNSSHANISYAVF